MNIREATTLDIEAIYRIDHLAGNDGARLEFIRKSVNSGMCSVAE